MLEEALPPHVRPPGSRAGVPPRRLLELLLPGGGAQALRLADPSPAVPDTLLKVDEQGVSARGGGTRGGGVHEGGAPIGPEALHEGRPCTRVELPFRQASYKGQALHEDKPGT